jgi:hypothetical protein
MVLASENAHVTAFLLDQGVGTVATHIVVAVDVALAILDKEEVEAGFRDLSEVPRVFKPVRVRNKNPALGEDRSPFELVHAGRPIPHGRQSS